MTTTAERLRTFWGDRQFDRERVSALAVRYWEIALYATLVGAALGLRLWGLDARAIHHDEALHMIYAWDIFKLKNDAACGCIYEHVPFMHGPLKFFGTAATLRIFGDNDYAARILYAFAGTAMVGLPYFLRSYLGRIGALTAAFLIALSPSLLYVSRFNRDDILITAFTLGTVVVIWRYLREQNERYLYLIPLLLMLGFTSMEMTFITTAIFLTFLEVRLASDLVDQLRASRRLDAMQVLVAYAVLLLFGWLIAIAWPLIDTQRKRWSLEEMPAAGNLMVAIGTFSAPQFAAGIQRLGFGNINAYDAETGTHEQLRIVTTLGLLFASAYIGLIWNWKVWSIGAVIFYVPYVLIYTTFFTNLGGFWTGIWGSLDYWLSQQPVRRGSQPDYYYFMFLPVYEFLPLVFALGGALYYAFRGKLDQILLSAAAVLLILVFSLIPSDQAGVIGEYHMSIAFVIAIVTVLLLSMDQFTKFLLFWTLSVFFALSIAGEKMPWLTVHIALPLALLAARVIDDILSSLGSREAAPAEAKASPAAATRLLTWDRAVWLVYAAVPALLAAVVFQGFGPASGVSALAWLLVLVAAGAVFWVLRTVSWQAAGQVATVALFGALVVFTARAAGMAAYDEGDPDGYPQEMLIYAQGSPKLDDIFREIEKRREVSDVPVVIDGSDNIWPWPWYFRNPPYYTSDNFEGDFAPPEGAIVLVRSEHKDAMTPYLADYFDPIPYKHMWWFAPGAYAGIHQSDFVADVFNGHYWGTWRRYFIDRELANAYETPDMLAYFPKSSVEPDFRPPNNGPVDADLLPADSVTVIGAAGSEVGQFSQPADVTTDLAGNVYVVDTVNERIQKIAPDGTATAFGEEGDGDGEFNDPYSSDYQNHDGPWGVAVDREGNIYVADTWNHRIQVFKSDFSFLRSWGTGDELFGPRDIAVDAQGNVLVVDTGHKRIAKYNPEGQLMTELVRAGSGPAQFNEPSSVSLAPNGDIYVADYWNQRIQHFDPSLRYIDEIKVDSWGSRGITDRAYIAVLNDGRILATDPASDRIIVFSPQGEVERSWRLPGGPSRTIGIAVDANNQVYVVDSLASRVLRVPLDVLLAPPVAATTPLATTPLATTP